MPFNCCVLLPVSIAYKNLLFSGFDAFGDVLQPISSQSKMQTCKPEKAIQGDLDSSLANLAGNLHMDGPASQVKKLVDFAIFSM